MAKRKQKARKSRPAAKQAKRLYEAAKSSQYHRPMASSRSPDGVMDAARGKVRDWARYLDENHDLAIGILDDMVNKVVGNGLLFEPLVRGRDGALDETVNERLRELWTQWRRRPDTTGEIPGPEMDRLLCRTWLRDGEVLIQHVEGPRIRHFSAVPYSLELIEPDYLPFELFASEPSVTHGVEKDGWGRPIAYHLYKEHPGNNLWAAIGVAGDTKRVPRDRIEHIKFTRRLRQTRGVSVLHGIVHRLDDIKDYEESERIAARVAAAFTGYVKRSADMIEESSVTGTDRTLEMAPGMIFDNLLPGEEIGTIGTDRPNTSLQDFRNAMLRAAAAGTGANYSSISRDYNGTYSAQRQEMVESAPAYGRLRSYFVEAYARPVYERFVIGAVLAGLVPLPRGFAIGELFEVDIRGPGMAWIDPKKEVEADALAVQHGFKSRTQVIRERGGDPRQVDAERAADPMPAQSAEPAPDAPAETDDDEEEAAA
jgi:lambda family phage portal protein